MYSVKHIFPLGVLVILLIVFASPVLTSSPRIVQAESAGANDVAEIPKAITTNCTGGMVMDDGTFENGNGNVVTPMVTLFTIPGPVYQIQQVCICMLGLGPTTATFDVVMYDNTGPGGEPGTEVARFGPNNVTGIAQYPASTWYDIPLTYTTAGGPLFIGLDFADSTNRFVCGDTSLTYNQTNKFDSGGTWYEMTSMDYGIRAEGMAPLTNQLNVPHVTDIQINAGTNVAAYDAPAGGQAKLANGQDIILPHDYDGNGFDTYVVTDTDVMNGVTWYEIFLGSEDFVWVNGNQVILLHN